MGQAGVIIDLPFMELQGMLKRLAVVILLSGGFLASPAVLGPDAMAAAKKKISKKSSDFTPAQRAKLMQEARKICKKRYGAGARVYRLDYYHWKVWCQEG